MAKKRIIHGYGVPKEFELSVENVLQQTEDMELGTFVRSYDIDNASGGNIMGQIAGMSLDGVMYEFEQAFFVVWSCGEYIDWAIFRKEL